MNWRTSTVVQLCQAMRETQDYSATPILADALEDAEYSDREMLDKLRSGLPAIEAQRLVAMVYSDETAEAVEWMKQFIRDINDKNYPETEDGDYDYKNGTPSDTDPHTYDYVMEMAGTALKGKSTGYNGGHWMDFGSDDGADYFRAGTHNVREFFRNWSLITGLPAPEESQDKITFSCAC